MIFMKLNEWITFIKESRDWHASKCWSIDYCLIKKYNNDDNDNDNKAIDTKVTNILRYLYDDSMRILLTFRVSAWYRIWDIIDNSIDDEEEIVKVMETDV